MTHTLNSIPLLEKKSQISVIILFSRQMLLSPLVVEKAQILILVWKGKMAFGIRS